MRKPLAGIFLLALLALGLWLLELQYLVGWEGEQWLAHTHYSVFGIVALVVAAYLLPIGNALQAGSRRLGQAGIELYFVGLAAYFVEKLILITLYTQFYGFLSRDWLLVLQGLVLVMTVLSFHFVTQRWLRTLRWQQTLALGAAMVLPYPLSLLCVQFLFNFSRENLFTDALKMGYPFFWLVLLLGVVGIFTPTYFQKAPAPAAQEDILDDLPEED